jgi:hypothetical protein
MKTMFNILNVRIFMRKFILLRSQSYILISIVFALTACTDISPGGGQVLDTETNLPIEGVEVLFDCEVGVNIEGVRSLRIVRTLTDAKGMFWFGFKDLRGCSFGSLTASKEGYENLSGPSDMVYGSLNRAHGFWFAPKDKAAMRKLKNLYGPTVKTKKMEKMYPFAQGPKFIYLDMFERFVQSKSIAKTKIEHQFVIDNYCSRLVSTYESLLPMDKEALSKQSQWIQTEPQITLVSINHEKEVLSFCHGISAL